QGHCSINNDCLLIDKSYGFRCCHSGACDPIDYALDKWIAVNKLWFKEMRERNCPPLNKCEEGIDCALPPINDRFTSECINKICKKIGSSGVAGNSTISRNTPRVKAPVA